MADGFVILNPGLGGEIMDEELVGPFPTPPTTRLRSRVVVAGTGVGDIAPVIGMPPDPDECGLVVRPIFDPNTSIPIGLAGDPVVEYGEITGIGSGSETTVVSFIVPIGKTFNVSGFVASGDVDAQYFLRVDGVLTIVSRTTSANLTTDISFKLSFPIATAGQTVALRAEHDAIAASAEFNGTILGFIKDI